jgi:type 2A phosphatase activator TIP41
VVDVCGLFFFSQKKGQRMIINGWKIEATKSPIMSSQEMEAFQKKYDMPSLPEMIHGRSVVRFSHDDLSISFNAMDALIEWRKHCFERTGPRVANAKAWKEERAETLLDIPSQQYDWTFHSEYSGTIEGGVLEASDEGIPYERLKVKEDILLWEQLVLMEDELADNGTCVQSVRVRVMPSGFFCLHRLLLRVDDVMASIHDTRIYHCFGSPVVQHEYSERCSTYEELRAAGRLPADPSNLADENFLYENLAKKKLENKVIRLK